jgi:putative MFS transporter
MGKNLKISEQDKLSAYQWKLLAFLSIATFFEGYDFMAVTQVLPTLAREMALTKTGEGILISVISLGTIAAFPLVKQADRWGRKRVLTITIVGYTLCTVMTGFSSTVVSFGIWQFLARIFLIGEWAVCMVYAAEEFPAQHRGFVMGAIQGICLLGSVTCAAIVPTLLETGYGWRMVYFVGVIPLILVAIGRRSLKETHRFLEKKTEDPVVSHGFTRIFRSQYRNRLLKLSLIWSLTYLCTNSAVVFWKQFAMEERGLTESEAATCIAIGYLFCLPFYFLISKMMDVVGRKIAATVVYTSCILGVLCSYTFHGTWMLTAALVLAIIGVGGVLPVLNAFTTELFPTDLRGDAFAWANNLLGRIGYVLSPVLVGLLAERTSFSFSLSILAVFPLVALALIWYWLPETSRLELEESSAL